MSTRNVANEVLSLLALVNADLPTGSPQRITIDEMRHFIAGCQGNVGEGSNVLEFEVSASNCAVVVEIEQFNVDDTDPMRPQRITIGSEGIGATRAEVPTQWAIGADLFYVFGPGKATLTISASPEPASVYFARAVGYFLPVRMLTRLSRIGTRVINVPAV